MDLGCSANEQACLTYQVTVPDGPRLHAGSGSRAVESKTDTRTHEQDVTSLRIGELATATHRGCGRRRGLTRGLCGPSGGSVRRRNRRSCSAAASRRYRRLRGRRRSGEAPPWLDICSFQVTRRAVRRPDLGSSQGRRGVLGKPYRASRGSRRSSGSRGIRPAEAPRGAVRAAAASRSRSQPWRPQPLRCGA